MSNNKQQTAVNFLIKEFSDILGPIETKPMQNLLMMDAMKRAKEMEKQQIMDAHYAPKYGCFNEEYYKETYGGKDGE